MQPFLHYTLLLAAIIFTSTAHAQTPIPITPPSPAAEKITAALSKTSNFTCNRASLHQVVKDVRKNFGINVEIDRKVLEKKEIDWESVAVTCDLKNVTLQQFLDAALHHQGMTTSFQADALLLTAPGVYYDQLSAIIYPIADLIDKTSEAASKSSQEELVEILTSLIDENHWSTVGGPGALAHHGLSESFLISQTEEIHHKIADLLTALRKVKALQSTGAELPTAVPTKIPTPAEVKLLAALEKSFSANYEETPLSKVLEDIRRDFGIHIRVLRGKLADAGLDEKTLLVTSHVKDVQLKNFMKSALSHFSLVAIPIEGTLFITTPEDGCWNGGTLVVYPVADLIDWYPDPAQKDKKLSSADNLIELIASMLSPNNWDEVGGDGSLSFHSYSSSLVILQDDYSHDKIAKLLVALRRAQKWKATEVAPIPIDPPTIAQQKILAALQKPISATYAEAPLNEVLDRIRKENGMEIILRENTSCDKTDSMDERVVTCQLQDISLRSFLNTILRDHDLCFKMLLEREAILITDRFSQVEQVTTVVYPIADLARDPAFVPTPNGATTLHASEQSLDFDSVIELISRTIDSRYLDESDTSFCSHELSQSLVVSLPEAAHKEIAELLSALRRSRDLQGILLQENKLSPAKQPQTVPTAIPCEPPTPAAAKIEAAWQKTLSAHYVETPLSEVLDRLRKDFGINIHICQQELTDAEVDFAALKVTCNLEGVTLRSFLDRLGTTHHFAAVYHDEAICVTADNDNAVYSAAITRVYPIADLLDQTSPASVSSSCEKLAETTVNIIEPNSWDAARGPGTLSGFSNSQSLVANNTEQVHHKISNFLVALRKAKQLQSAVPNK